MLPDNLEVIYQIANCYDYLGDFKLCVKWFDMLSSMLPNDPGIQARLGAIHARFDDEVKALHHYMVSWGEGGEGCVW
jgi:intraflagellar transport protein 88